MARKRAGYRWTLRQPKDKEARRQEEAQRKEMGVEHPKKYASFGAAVADILAKAGKTAEKESITEKDVDPKQLAMGIEIEMEHTDDREEAKRIALDHLAEMGDYYTRLKKMESEKSFGKMIDDLCKAPYGKMGVEYLRKLVTVRPKKGRAFSSHRWVRSTKGRVAVLHGGKVRGEAQWVGVDPTGLKTDLMQLWGKKIGKQDAAFRAKVVDPETYSKLKGVRRNVMNIQDSVSNRGVSKAIESLDNAFDLLKGCGSTKDKIKWEKAKKVAKKGYPEKSQKARWPIVQKIYQQMKGKKAAKSVEENLADSLDLLKALPGRLEKRGKRKEKVLVEGAHRTPPKEYREGGATKGKHYADPKNYKYPIDTEAHVRAAISYFSKPKNANVYSKEEQKSIWARIKRAAKKYGIALSEKSGPPSVEKSKSEISADLLKSGMASITERAGLWGEDSNEFLKSHKVTQSGQLVLTPEGLEKALGRAGLVKKRVPVKGKTKTYQAYRWVREGETSKGWKRGLSASEVGETSSIISPVEDALEARELHELWSVGNPTEVRPDGMKIWRSRGALHREDGPAIESPSGYRVWYRNGQIHREDGPAIEKPSGYRAWYRNGQLHREDGPAIEGPDGSKEWYRNGQVHREDGPAIEKPDGSEKWYRNGQVHREDGPAVSYANGYRAWYRNGQLHREDGPAIIRPDGYQAWYLNGKQRMPGRRDKTGI